MSDDFLHARFGRTGPATHRVGFSATYRPGTDAVRAAIDAGLTYFFYFGFDRQMVSVLSDLPARDRQRLVIATGAYNYKWWHQDVVRVCERRLKQLGADYLDAFLFLGVLQPDEFTARARADLARLRRDGKVRCVGLSTHNRRLAAELAADGDIDVLMVRYNAAHPGAERDIFPCLQPRDPAVVAYTATCWTRLVRRARGAPSSFVPTAGDCYRFVLTHPAVDVCLMAPRSKRELQDNLHDIEKGPLPDDRMRAMRAFGAEVYRQHPWFM